MRVRYPDEVRTFLKADSASRQIDHVFTDARLHEPLVSSKVFEVVDGEPAVNLSDHTPILVVFDV